MGFDFLLVQPQAFIEKKKPRLRRKDWTRVYLKTPNAPGQRAFLRCAALFFLEIRQYSCEKMSCATQKSLAAGHIMSFQTHPSLAMGGLGRSEPHVVHQQKRCAAGWETGHQHTENAKFHPNGVAPRRYSKTSCGRTRTPPGKFIFIPISAHRRNVGSRRIPQTSRQDHQRNRRGTCEIS